ncbi:alpha/beta hydrolase family esterase [Solimonas soli]|uniref:alpha/beta hydrolase family esterase n=1 Tax=Solimonas soli TaxID=413479 RepID=UPI0004825102|nr:alpha/beta fold hydrolase [Solimonas soli]
MPQRRIACSLALSGLLALCACGGGDGATPAPVDGLDTVTLPGYPHSIDVYGVDDADKAVVILHGLGDHNYGIAHALGLNGNDGPPSEASVDFARLRARKIMAVLPQGQAIGANAYTWDNHVMRSGEDDVAFLEALADYIRQRYGVSKVYLMGHSNGGMMANRFWCESPQTFDGYVAIAGPASEFYLDHACAPSVAQPYYGIIGNSDQVLGVDGDWAAATWTVTPLLVQASPPGSWVDPTLIGEWQVHQRHARLACGATPTLLQAARSGNVDTWTDCDGRLKVQRVFTGEHKIASLESAAGFSLFDAAADFIDGLP